MGCVSSYCSDTKRLVKQSFIMQSEFTGLSGSVENTSTNSEVASHGHHHQNRTVGEDCKTNNGVFTENKSDHNEPRAVEYEQTNGPEHRKEVMQVVVEPLYDIYFAGSNKYQQIDETHEHCYRQSTTSTRMRKEQYREMGGEIRVKQIVCGCYNTLFLTDRNEVYGQGKLRGNKRESSYMEKIPLPSDVIIQEIVATGDHSFVLTTTGTVWSFGDSTWSQTGLGLSAGSFVYPPQQIQRSHFDYVPVTYISSGYGHSAFMTKYNEVFTCGANNHCQLGLNKANYHVEFPTRIEIPPDCDGVKKVVCGCAFLYIISHKNKVYSCGSNNHGQCAQGVDDQVIPQLKLVSVAGFDKRKIVDMVCGQYYAIFIEDDHSLWACGKNKHGLLGINSYDQTTNVPAKICVPDHVSFKHIHAGYTHWLAVSSDNIIYGCGMSANGQLGCRDVKGYKVPTLLDQSLQTGRINYVAGSFQHSVFYHSDKEMEDFLAQFKRSFLNKLYFNLNRSSFTDIEIHYYCE